MQFPYSPRLKLLPREWRKHATLAEVLLWQQPGKGRRGHDFHRQKPIDEYIVDFLAPDRLLAVKIDGSSHKLKTAEDAVRQNRLESLGMSFLRYDETIVRMRLDAVVRDIDRWIEVKTFQR